MIVLLPLPEGAQKMMAEPLSEQHLIASSLHPVFEGSSVSSSRAKEGVELL